MTDEKTISALVASHAVWLTAFLRGLTGCEADAEDAFQEVWLRVFKGHVPSDPKAERAYLVKVARSVVIDRHRKNARYVLSLDDSDAEKDEMADASPSPAERFETSATREMVLAAIRDLPNGPREVLLLRIEGELTFQEISETLGIPLGTTLTWMRRATARLKKTLERR